MCGIAGAFSFHDGAGPVNHALILKLNELQRRRGPDGAGLWQSDDGCMVLGHRRLAIIDIGSKGAQPMSDATGRWIISFNGEIYNYRALRAELQRLGCNFCTNSDTEVIINAVAQWGESGLRRLRGMYAFALWDTLERELWLRSALGAAEMRQQDDLAALAGDLADGRRDPLQPCGIGDTAVFHRHVEIDAQQHALALHVDVIEGAECFCHRESRMA